jgi:hypothetical protein
MEAMGDFEPQLRASIRRMPTDLSVWLVNRLLNDDSLGNPARQAWLSELRKVANRADIPDSVRQSALHFLNYQTDKNRS